MENLSLVHFGFGRLLKLTGVPLQKSMPHNGQRRIKLSGNGVLAVERAFGFALPLDDELHSRPYPSWEYGLLNGRVVRWYVGRETEYYAILQVLPEPSRRGIELVNSWGVLAAEKDSIPLMLQDWLMEDKKLRRFSLISFDFDVAANRKAIQQQVEQQNVVGFIATHKPDFEFDNFAIQELAEVAAQIDEASGYSEDAVRNADWKSIDCGSLRRKVQDGAR